jgi:hypothetical protein
VDNEVFEADASKTFLLYSANFWTPTSMAAEKARHGFFLPENVSEEQPEDR